MTEPERSVGSTGRRRSNAAARSPGRRVERQERRHRKLPQPPLRLLVVGGVQADHANRLAAQARHDVEIEAAQVERDDGDLADAGLGDGEQLGDVRAATAIVTPGTRSSVVATDASHRGPSPVMTSVTPRHRRPSRRPSRRPARA